jgi:calpain-9
VETFSGEAVQLVKMRNALGPATDYTGPWSIDSAEWSEVSPNSLERLQTKLGEGEFWISYPDFIKTFTHMEVIHLDSDTSRDEPSLHNKNTWQMRLYQGNWLKGVSAGGCRNNPDTFHINPQLHLLLSEMEEVVVSLNQHSIMEPKSHRIYGVFDTKKQHGNDREDVLQREQVFVQFAIHKQSAS